MAEMRSKSCTRPIAERLAGVERKHQPVVTQGPGIAHIEIANPVAQVRPKAAMPARRLDSLAGKKITLWWNGKSQGDVALRAAAEAIERRFENVTFTLFTRLLDQRPGPYEATKAGGCDAVIASTGD